MRARAWSRKARMLARQSGFKYACYIFVQENTMPVTNNTQAHASTRNNLFATRVLHRFTERLFGARAVAASRGFCLL